MGLLSFFKRQSDSANEAPAAAAPDAVAAARTRARRRLIGAAVLLGAGVIGFPLLFETQPRPIPVNIPIEIPRKDNVPPLVLPAAAPPLSSASAAVVADGLPPASAAKPAAEIVERAADQGHERPAPPAAVSAKPAPVVSARPEPSQPEPARPEPAKAEPAKVEAAKPSASKPAPVAKPGDDGARARALLDGQPASMAGARVVVQVGAYTEPTRLREARQKLEKMGFKTYTQVVEGEGGKRTRVRVGPFASRAEADKAAARIKASGLPVAVLTL
jgi:DedD protein